MARLQGYGWLLAGAVLAVLVPALGLDRQLLAALGMALPLPWGRLLLAALVFWCAAGLYFRSHWGATVRRLREREALLDMVVGRLGRLEADADRSAFVIRDNLAELTEADPAPAQARLYLEGAAAHAGKIGEIGKRCAALRREIEVGGKPE